MITPVLQMLVFVGSAFGFAWYVLTKDKQENPPQVKREDLQKSIPFPDSEHERHDAAMSHL
jgi:hypothetical protein